MTVRTVLLTYELGSGLGHLGRLIAVARRLVERCRLVFVVPDLAIAKQPLDAAFGQRVEVLHGPSSPPLGGLDLRVVPTHSFADVLRLFGFDDPSRVRRSVARWQSVVSSVRPDLIIADFAPSLRLALDDTIPLVVLGNGYTVPPSGRPLPPMRPWQTDVPSASRRMEGRILEVFNEVRNDSGSLQFANLADVFSGHVTFISTLRLFDPYAAHRGELTIGPFNVPGIARGSAVRDERAGPDIFAYIPATHPQFDVLIETLNVAKRPVHLYVSDADPHVIAARCARHIGILSRPADFARMMPNTKLLIHHAGLATAYAGLIAGTPQLLLPLNLEHLITARALIDAGVGLGYSANMNVRAQDLHVAISRLLDETVWFQRAVTAAAMFSANTIGGLEIVVAACERLLSREVGD